MNTPPPFIITPTNNPNTLELRACRQDVKVLLSRARRDNPAIVLLWDNDNLQAVISQINAANPELPSWMEEVDASLPLNTQTLRHAIVANLSSRGGVSDTIGDVLIGTDTEMQYGNVKSAATDIGHDPVWQHVNPECFPLVRFYLVKKRPRNEEPAVATADPVMAPTGGIAVIAEH